MNTVNTVFSPAPLTYIPIIGIDEFFPVRRVYCVARNYEEHAKEMGFTEREAPFFFTKPTDAIIPIAPDSVGYIAYPSLTDNYHHEVECVIAIHKAGVNITLENALSHVYGYAVGLDMTRRDLQMVAKQQGRPWCISKAVDESAPISAITRFEDIQTGFNHLQTTTMQLSVNNNIRQTCTLNEMIWSIPEIIVHLSKAWTLQPGDLIFTGTPKGVGAVHQGDILSAHITGLASLNLIIK